MEPYQIENVIEAVIVGSTIIFIAFSPIARAIANRIMHGRMPAPGSTPLPDPRMDDLLDENAMLRRQLDEVQERVTFAERMIAQQRDKTALPGAR